MDYPFLTIPMAIIEDERLNNAQMILYGIILSTLEEQPYCKLKNRDLSRIMKTSESSILIHLDALERCGHIDRTIIRRETTNEVIERRIYLL